MPRGKIILLAGGASINNATFTGQSLFADGTQTLPSIAFTSDPDTGFFWANSGEIRVASNGNQILAVASSSITPVVDNAYALGGTANRWSSVHAKTVTIGQTLSGALIGEVTLSGSPPLAIIYNSAITATSTTRIFLTKCLQRPATIGAAVAISTSASGQATVVSLSTGDTSVVNYWIIPTS